MIPESMKKIYLARLRYHGSFWWMQEELFSDDGEINPKAADEILRIAIELQYD